MKQWLANSSEWCSKMYYSMMEASTSNHFGIYIIGNFWKVPIFNVRVTYYYWQVMRFNILTKIIPNTILSVTKICVCVNYSHNMVLLSLRILCQALK